MPVCIIETGWDIIYTRFFDLEDGPKQMQGSYRRGCFDSSRNAGRMDRRIFSDEGSGNI